MWKADGTIMQPARSEQHFGPKADALEALDLAENTEYVVQVGTCKTLDCTDIVWGATETITTGANP
jgi:hypothetical protein